MTNICWHDRTEYDADEDWQSLHCLDCGIDLYGGEPLARFTEDESDTVAQLPTPWIVEA